MNVILKYNWVMPDVTYYADEEPQHIPDALESRLPKSAVVVAPSAKAKVEVEAKKASPGNNK